MDYQKANQLRFDKNKSNGHYESYFIRANHPTEKLAFWFRYTLFQSKSDYGNYIGEIWGAIFKNNEVVAIQQDIDASLCQFDDGINLDGNKLIFPIDRSGKAIGIIDNQKGTSISWNLEYQSNSSVLGLFPDNYYDAPFPKAKLLVGKPNAEFNGEIYLNDEKILIDNWQGSENHNWGPQHTDEYAWGQVSGFDNDDSAFLECATARVKIAGIKSPKFTVAVLRLNEGEESNLKVKEYRFTGLWQGLKNSGQYRFLDQDICNWEFKCQQDDMELLVKIQARKSDFVGLRYRNPPTFHMEKHKTCLNSKVASCDVVLKKSGKVIHHLTTNNRAAFEILTDSIQHEIQIHNQ